MKLTQAELDYLSAWAREEWETECYHLPAHRLQLSHQISGALLIDFIKCWTRSEGKRDSEIAIAADTPEPDWPWASPEEFHARHGEAVRIRRETKSSANS